MLWILALVPAFVILVLACWRMLHVIAARGGEREGDAAATALQVLAQAGAFRGDDRDRRVPWDGVPRLRGVEGNDGGGA